jgi:large subunit ribosomal protein L22
MKAYLRSARIAPKKANLIAMMVRGMRVDEALVALSRTHKKGARMVEVLVKSAVANAQHNDKQKAGNLMIKTIIVNQGTPMRRGTPMARGRMRPMNKFMSHITLALGIAEGVHAEKMDKKEAAKAAKKPTASKKTPSQTVKTPVKDTDSVVTPPVAAPSEAQAEPTVSPASN